MTARSSLSQIPYPTSSQAHAQQMTSPPTLPRKQELLDEKASYFLPPNVQVYLHPYPFLLFLPFPSKARASTHIHDASSPHSINSLSSTSLSALAVLAAQVFINLCDLLKTFFFQSSTRIKLLERVVYTGSLHFLSTLSSTLSCLPLPLLH